VKTLTAAIIMACAVAAPASAGFQTGSPADITTIVKQAITKIRSRAEFKKAVLLEADGRPAHGKVTTAAAITRWRIVFQNQTTKSSKFASAYMNVVNGKLGKVVGVHEPFLEDVDIHKIPKMTLAGAVKKLRAAGHTKPFGAVTLRYPLGPGFHEPLYIFGFGSGAYWTVGTKTGKVKRIS
jgi:hypothetical protein